MQLEYILYTGPTLCDCTISAVRPVNPFLHQSFYDQQMLSIIMKRLVHNGECFGIVRAVDSSMKRVWQEHEIIAIETMANVVAMIKYMEKYEE